MDKRVEKLVEETRKQLTPNKQRMLQLLSFEPRKDKIMVRMPLDVISLDEVWKILSTVAFEQGIKLGRADTFATLEELDDLLTEVKWLWKGWIPRGFVSMLVGDPGVGKSMLALDWVRTVTSGSCWPLEPKPTDRAANVVWIDTEASQQLLNIRSKKIGVERGRVTIPVIDGDILAQVDVSQNEHREQILSMIEAKKPALLVLDSLSGAHNRGENRVEDVKPVMEFFALVARDYDLAVLAIHHLNKNYAGDTPDISLYRIRGSMAIPQFARSILAIEAIGDGRNKLKLIKSNLARIANPITVTAREGSDGEICALDYVPYSAPPPKKTKKETCAEWLSNALSNGHSKEGLSLKDLQEMGMAVGFTRANLYAAKEILGERIFVSGTGNTAFWHMAEVDTESINSIIGAKNGKH